ncbi:DUF1000-domain-containing protein [Ascobolus immersus RN42]|uniref:DUF1000-domain-containing protein n=1 Tax=Ascobolus immersus RN42 TaxID=1160509 RepID=A0A3N4ILP4_ASCIM|nr:DUF1000-domain-containing protein [Ascobolus immersus RN42]
MTVIPVQSPSQLRAIAETHAYTVVDFYADWCGPCHAIGPIFEKLAATTAEPGKIAFVKIDVEASKTIVKEYEITSMPTFVLLKDGKEESRIKGAVVTQLKAAVQKIAELIRTTENSAANVERAEQAIAMVTRPPTPPTPYWLGADVPKNYWDITDQIDIKGIDILNRSADAGTSRAIIKKTKPSALAAKQKGKGKEEEVAEDEDGKDWIESDTDEQLMILIPFQSNVKAHTIQITSLAESPEENDDDEVPSAPQTIKFYTNAPSILGFDEAENHEATFEYTLSQSDYNANGTANIPLRFVKFQRVSSIVMFVVDALGGKEKVRLDRVRIIGESGEKREMGTLEKVE